MRDLRLIGVHDDGEHLVVTDETGEEFRLRIDESLRAAVRRDRPRLGQLQIAIDDTVRPREVQAMIRAGMTADEVAARTGWDLTKIARFEGPVLAEREHAAVRAQSVRMRGHNQAGAPETLGQRAATRLTARGVDPSSVEWDACRSADGQWVVTAVFTAGGRERTATWWFDVAGMSVVAKNDEAKWLSEADAPAGPVPQSVHRPTAVFDVEVEETKAERATRANTDDLIASMREQSGARGRRRGGRRRERTAAGAPPVTEDALPLEEATDERPPAAGGTHPKDLEAETADPEDTTPETVADGDGDAAAQPPAETGSATTEPAGSAGDTPPAEEGQEADPSGQESVAEHSPEKPSEEPGPTGEKAEEETTSAGRGKRGRGRSRKGRASVPSWDDVMFGTSRE